MRLSNPASLLSKPKSSLPRAILILGREASLTGFYAELFTHLYGSCRTLQTLRDIDELAEHTSDLFSQDEPKENCIHVQRVTASELSGIIKLVDSKEVFYIFEGPGIKAKTKIVEYFSEHPNFSLCPAYEITTSTMAAILRYQATLIGLEMTPKQMQELVPYFCEYPGTFFRDFQKISLLKHGDQERFSVQDDSLQALLTPLSSKAIDPIIDAFMTKNLKEFLNRAKRSIFENHDYLLLRSLLNQCRLMLELYGNFENGMSFDQGFRSLSKPFFHKKPIFLKASSIWLADQFRDVITALLEIEKNYKVLQQSPSKLIENLFFLLKSHTR